jgi:hypothetical protein
VISVAAAGVGGDYNNDGFVDAADYTVWRNRLGENIILTNQNPAAATPGLVDLEDYAYWKSQYGQSAGGGASDFANAAVPEPSTWVLLVFAAMGWFARRSRGA